MDRVRVSIDLRVLQVNPLKKETCTRTAVSLNVVYEYSSTAVSAVQVQQSE